MQLEELCQLIRATQPSDWSHIGTSGTLGGPTYHAAPDFDDDQGCTPAHHHLAVLRSDIDVSVAWGMEFSRELEVDWADRFRDRRVIGIYADVFYRNGLVIREPLWAVDGWRYFLPMSDEQDEVTEWQRDLARLVHGFIRTRDFDEAFARTGMKLVPDVPGVIRG